MKFFMSLSIVTLVFCVAQPTGAVEIAQSRSASEQMSKRPVTVVDAIQMTKLDPGPDNYSSTVSFSRDGEGVVAVLRKGNIEQNTNEYSLVMWRTGEIFNSPKGEVLLTMAASSNRAAIEDVTWCDDNQALVFLGENPGELRQLYSLNIRTHALKQLTYAERGILSYTVTPRGDKILYFTIAPDRNYMDDRTRRLGFPILRQRIQELEIFGGVRKGAWQYERQLFFLLTSDLSHPKKLSDNIPSDGLSGSAFLSPDGRYALIDTLADHCLESWIEYSDPDLKEIAQQALVPGSYLWIHMWELLDTATGARRLLWDAPLKPRGVLHEATWAPDGQSVVITNTYLPLSGVDPDERKIRLSTSFSAIEVKISSGKVAKISQEDLHAPQWIASTGLLSFETGKWDEAVPRVYFHKVGQNWEKVQGITDEIHPDIVQEQDLNTPPKIFAVHAITHRKVLLLDLNPQFDDLKFGREEEVHWKGSDGHEHVGGLYYPIDYRPGRRYPLVIQTHGYLRDKFWIDGPYPTAFAAQPLAGKDIVVLQADEDLEGRGSPKEVDREMAAYEGAVDDLDRRGLVDRNRVGIIGFSRTCLTVKYTLTHSKYHFAAAAVADGVDGGYLQYVLNANIPGYQKDSEGLNGGKPWDEGLQSWLRRSPVFNIAKVQTPLRIMSLGFQGSLLFEWEWFAAMGRLGKPVELVTIEDGSHELTKPWDRLASQQGNVDWFSFWLLGEEDPDPDKADQYVRWRELRKLQAASGRLGPANR